MPMRFPSFSAACRCLAACASVVLLAGCPGGGSGDGPDKYPVSGVVTLDGVPVEGATVTFVGGTPMKTAFGTTNSNGEYQLTSSQRNDGTTPGAHRVTVSKVVRDDANFTEGPDIDSDEYDPYSIASDSQYMEQEESQTLLPKRYASKDESGLTANVEESDNEINFDLVTN